MKRPKPKFRVRQVVMHRTQNIPMKIRRISECGGFEYSSQPLRQIPMWIPESYLRELSKREIDQRPKRGGKK